MNPYEGGVLILCLLGAFWRCEPIVTYPDGSSGVVGKIVFKKIVEIDEKMLLSQLAIC